MNAKTYLDQHGITEETIELFELSWDEDYLHIPIKDEEGNDLFIKSRFLKYEEQSQDKKQPKYKNSLGSHATLFNYYAVKDSTKLVLTEGELDAMKLMQEGIPAISSTGGAGTFPPEFKELLKDKKIYICYDNDEAGTKGIRSLLDIIPTARVVQLPKDTKDVCEYFQAGYTIDDFLKRMKLAQTRSEFISSHLPEEYQLLSGKELMSLEFEEVPWLIEPMIYNQGFCFIYGAEGIGKSFLALSIAKAVAEGEDWLGVYKANKPTPVLYLDKENPHSLMQKRAKGLGGIPDNLYWLKYPAQFSLHDGKGNASEFAMTLSTLIEEKQIGLIVIDSFVDLMIGNESSAEDTQRFFDGLRVLYPNVAYLVLHHENKPSPGAFRTAGQRLRGSTNINAQTFTMFRLEAVAKSKTEMTLQQTKARDEQKLDKFMIKMIVESDPNNLSKTIVTGFEFMGIVVESADAKSEEAEEFIRNTLSEQFDYQLSRQELVAIASASGLSQRTIDRTLKSMEDEKAIAKVRKGKEVFIKLNYPIVSNFEENGGLF